MWLTEYMHVLENGDLLLQRCKRLAQNRGKFKMLPTFGQKCVSINRLLSHDSIHVAFLKCMYFAILCDSISCCFAI